MYFIRILVVIAENQNKMVTILYKSLLFLIVGFLISCDKKKDSNELEYNTFIVESQSPTDRIQFKLPKNYQSVRELNPDQLKDTTLLSLVYRQEHFSESYIFYDTSNCQNFVSILSGLRVNISNKEPNITYFSVPTMRLDQVFPPADDSRKIISELKDKKYRDKTYYKRKYQLNSEERVFYQTLYYIITTSQSSLIIVNNIEDINLDKYILEMDVIRVKR